MLFRSVSQSRYNNGINYDYTIEDALKQQGYNNGVEYERVFNWNNYQTYIKKLAEIKPYKEPMHNIKAGDIFYNSWGYDQTNIDFYQVVAATAKTITIQKIKGHSEDYDQQFMTGHKMPVIGSFTKAEKLRKTPYLLNGEWRISFDYGAGCKWDGRPLDFSCYA